MQKRLNYIDPMDDIGMVFKEFDSDGDGYISAYDLKFIMHSLGQQLTDDEIDQMIEVAKPKIENKISYSGKYNDCIYS